MRTMSRLISPFGQDLGEIAELSSQDCADPEFEGYIVYVHKNSAQSGPSEPGTNQRVADYRKGFWTAIKTLHAVIDSMPMEGGPDDIH